MIYTSQDVYENGSTTPTFHELLEYDDNEELYRNTRTETKNGHEYTTVHSAYVKVGESKKNTTTVQYEDNVMSMVTNRVYNADGSKTYTIFKYENGEPVSVETQEYDAQGNESDTQTVTYSIYVESSRGSATPLQ